MNTYRCYWHIAIPKTQTILHGEELTEAKDIETAASVAKAKVQKEHGLHMAGLVKIGGVCQLREGEAGEQA